MVQIRHTAYKNRRAPFIKNTGNATMNTRCAQYSICFIVALSLVELSCPSVAALELQADTPWIVAEDEPEPMRRALEDVARDWYKVLGYRPIILHEPPADYAGPLVYFGVKGDALKSLKPKNLTSVESFNVRVTKDAAGRQSLVATGTDMRGAMYAAYAVSEYLLGVDPWYYWVDKEPAYRGEVRVADDYDRTFGPPTYRYRGWFINDEDLLHAYAADPMRETIFSLAMWDRVFETILRLRGNMVVPGTFTFPDERCQTLAARRGLILNMHHILTVGLNTYQWPEDQPFSYNRHPEVLERYWRECIDEFKDKEVVWTVGYRGKHDRPFWYDEPEMKTAKQRAEVISAAIAKQVEMVRQAQPEADIITNLWWEGVEMYESGYLKIPEGVIIVWPDDGFGRIRDRGRSKQGQGFYYHTHMRNGRANQLTEMVNPGRIHENVGRLTRAGATKFFLVNVSDVRGVPLSTDCAMKLAWNAEPCLRKSNRENMDAFLLDWCERQYGSAVAKDAARQYDRFFHIPYLVKEPPRGEDHFISVVRLVDRELTEQLREEEPFDRQKQDISPVSRERVENYIAYTTDLLKDAEKLRPRIPVDRREFYQYHVISQTRVHLALQNMLYAYLTGVEKLKDGDKQEAAVEFERTLKAFDDAQSALRLAEYGKWRGFYEFNIMSSMLKARTVVKRRLALTRGEPAPPLRPFEDFPELYDYQRPFAKNFPFLYPHAN